MVAAAGLEPARPFGPGILSALSLPFLQAAIGPALSGHFRSFNRAQMAYVWLSPNKSALRLCNYYSFHNIWREFKPFPSAGFGKRPQGQHYGVRDSASSSFLGIRLPQCGN